MTPTNTDWRGNPPSVAVHSALRASAWRIAAGLLFALTVINIGAVMLTASTFSAMFMIATILNIALALALRAMQSWARILTLARCLLGIALAIALAVTEGAVNDAVVTTLLLAGIALPILGPPHRMKSLAGIAIFALGGIATVTALLAALVTTN